MPQDKSPAVRVTPAMLSALPGGPLSPFQPYPVRLDIFEGPLDLLLYLIRRHELNIHDIPIAFVTQQFTAYLHAMKTLDLDVAGEYMVMAATLIHIKSRLLLPAVEGEEGQEGEDPRANLVERLLEYERFKLAAEELEKMEAREARLHPRPPEALRHEHYGVEPGVDADVYDLAQAFRKILERLAAAPVLIEGEEYTLEEKCDALTALLAQKKALAFSELVLKSRSVLEAVVWFLALLEIVRRGTARARQSERFEEIFIYAAEVPETAPSADGGSGVIIPFAKND